MVSLGPIMSGGLGGPSPRAFSGVDRLARGCRGISAPVDWPANDGADLALRQVARKIVLSQFL